MTVVYTNSLKQSLALLLLLLLLRPPPPPLPLPQLLLQASQLSTSGLTSGQT